MLLPDALDILKARLESINGLTVTTSPAVTVVVPMAVIDDGQMDYNASFKRGDAELAFGVTVYVSRADSGEGLHERRLFLSGHGDKSIRAALETQPTTGDALLNKVVVDTGDPGASDNYITATFSGRAHVPGAVAT